MMVKPAVAGAMIRDPQTKLPLPAEGGEVPDNIFWRRRLRDGDVVLMQESATPTGREPIAPLTTREEA